MGLSIDRKFYELLASSDASRYTDGRIFNTARTASDEDEDRVPYIIITHDGGQNAGESKDLEEGSVDVANISLLCVGTSRAELSALTEMVREVIKEGVKKLKADGNGFDYVFTFGPISYDSMKPCYYQDLKYKCVVEII
jgi:hypothetical protein